MNVPLLTICIATYNRSNYIAETLESIIPELTDDVELLIVDGASTDNTETVVNRYACQDQRVRYVRLDSKGGVDQDYCKAVELALGIYCWLFTDDDLVLPGAVSAVKTAINNGHCLILVNAEVRDNELTSVLQDRKICAYKDMSFSPDDSESLFMYTMNHLTFIGSVVIKREIWLNRRKEDYFGTEFVHVGVIFQTPLPGTAMVISDPYICIRYGNGQWKSRGFEVWMFKWPKLVWSFSHISDKAKRCVTRKQPWSNLAVLLYERGIGAYSIDKYHNFLSGMSVSCYWKACARMIACLPDHTLASMLYYFCRFFMPNKMFMYDLDSNR